MKAGVNETPTSKPARATVADLVARWSVGLDEGDAERPTPGPDASGHLSERLARILDADERSDGRRGAP